MFAAKQRKPPIPFSRVSSHRSAPSASPTTPLSRPTSASAAGSSPPNAMTHLYKLLRADCLALLAKMRSRTGYFTPTRPARSHLLRLASALFAFAAGICLTLALLPTESRLWCRRAATESTPPDPTTSSLLLTVILSAPANVELRNTIRTVWLPLATRIPAPLDSRIPLALTTPQFNAAGFVQPETVAQQAANLLMHRQRLPKTRRMRRDEHFVPARTQHRFVIGTAGLPRHEVNLLAAEQREHGDLLLLGTQYDCYANLTQKLLQTFDAVVYGGGEGLRPFRYLLKVDDDTYVKLDRMVAELMAYDAMIGEAQRWPDGVRPELYWGYFSAAAQVKTGGKWREENYVLADRYHPYALGGGYVLSEALVRWVADNAGQLVRFVSEDVSVGLWLSALRTVYRRHDVRFDTAWMQRKCRDYHMVLHKRSVRDMKMVRGGAVCSGVEDDEEQMAAMEVRRPREYFYDWHGSVAECCRRGVDDVRVEDGADGDKV